MLPLDLQKNLPTALALTRNPVYLEGYGCIECSRQLFAKVFEIFFTGMIYVELLLLSDHEYNFFIFYGSSTLRLKWNTHTNSTTFVFGFFQGEFHLF